MAITFPETNLSGQSRISQDDYIEGAPELIVEIAASSAAYDLHDKQEAYRRNGVQEYLESRYGNRISNLARRDDLTILSILSRTVTIARLKLIYPVSGKRCR